MKDLKIKKDLTKLSSIKKVLAIIPARKGSVGVKNKNIRLINNKPLIDFTVQSLKMSNLIDKIVITTNDERVISYYKFDKKLLIIKRSHNISNSKSTSSEYVDDVLKKINKTESYIPKTILIAQPTSPLRSTLDINNAIKKYHLGNKKSLISVCKAEGMRHPKDMYILKNNSEVRHLIRPKKKYETRDEYFRVYQRNGCIYLFDYHFFKKFKKVKSHNPDIYIMPWERSINIDIEDDFKIAKCLLKK